MMGILVLCNQCVNSSKISYLIKRDAYQISLSLNTDSLGYKCCGADFNSALDTLKR